jgi:hypothetical protein
MHHIMDGETTTVEIVVLEKRQFGGNRSSCNQCQGHNEYDDPHRASFGDQDRVAPATPKSGVR